MAKNLCLPSGACSHRCNSGKDCEGSRRASCMALGLHRLVQVDGGESVDTEEEPSVAEKVFVTFFFAVAVACLGLAVVAVFK